MPEECLKYCVVNIIFSEACEPDSPFVSGALCLIFCACNPKDVDAFFSPFSQWLITADVMAALDMQGFRWLTCTDVIKLIFAKVKDGQF